MMKTKRLKIMKKIVLFTAIFASLLASCTKENANTALINSSESNINKSAIVIGAATENISDVKSTYNSSWEVSWEETDKIGLVVSNSTNSWYTNQECTTTGSGTNVTFTSTISYNEVDKWNIAAFYPWNGSGSDVNNWYSSDDNAYNGVMYFKLPSSYSGYTSGKNNMPMLANLTGENIHPANMSFKHVGAGVHVKITDLPKGAHSIGLEVDGVQLWGNFNSISASGAGSSSLVGSGNSADNADQVWLNFTTLAADGSWDFIFPVPPLTTPTLSFKVYDKNDVCIWSRTATNQTSVGRAEILDMPELSIASSLYVVYIKDDTGWSGTKYLYAYNGSGNLRAWPGLESSGTETISGVTYQKFLLPKSAKDTKYYLIYNNYSSSVNLPDITLTSSAKKNYICTNGSATSIVSTSAPAAAVSKRIIDVGVISYLYNSWSEKLENVKVHYWNETTNGDVGVDFTGTQDTKKMKTEYSCSFWSDDESFHMSKAVIPSDATSFKVHYGETWFGDDASASEKKKAFIYNYDGDKAIYE